MHSFDHAVDTRSAGNVGTHLLQLCDREPHSPFGTGVLHGRCIDAVWQSTERLMVMNLDLVAVDNDADRASQRADLCLHRDDDLSRKVRV